jgi:hypothetical protein
MHPSLKCARVNVISSIFVGRISRKQQTDWEVGLFNVLIDTDQATVADGLIGISSWCLNGGQVPFDSHQSR